MKQGFVFLLSLCLLLSLAACGKAAPPAVEQPSAPAQDSVSADPEGETSAAAEPVGLPLEVGSYSLRFVSMEEFTDLYGEQAVRIYYDFTNNSAETVSADSLDFSVLQDGNELEITNVDDAAAVPEDANRALRVRPGAALRCTALFAWQPDGGELTVTVSDYDNDAAGELTLAKELLTGRPAEDFALTPVLAPNWTQGMPSSGVYEDRFPITLEGVEHLSGQGDGEVVRVFFTITNNTDEEISPWAGTVLHVYQDGVELKVADDYSYGEEESAYHSDFAPGASVRAGEGFILRSASPVEVEFESIFTPIAAVYGIG